MRDTAAALDAVAGYMPGDPYCATPPPGSYRDGMKRKTEEAAHRVRHKKLDGNALHPDCVAAVKRAAKLCAELGHEVEEASPALDQASSSRASWRCGAPISRRASTPSRMLTGQTPKPELFEGLTWGLYEAGKTVTASAYLIAKDSMNVAARETAKFHETYDFWLSATLGAPADEARHLRHGRARSGRKPLRRLSTTCRSPRCKT